METYYPCTWISFVNQKKWENNELKSVNVNYISNVPNLLLFERTDLYTVATPILWICRKLKHQQLRIRGEIFISQEIILNVF